MCECYLAQNGLKFMYWSQYSWSLAAIEMLFSQIKPNHYEAPDF